MKNFLVIIPDYEHEGDIQHELRCIKKICPKITNVKTWEERDREAEEDHNSDEPMYQGYISFSAPEEYVEKLEDNGYYYD